jgi:hypothetical protein
MVGHGRLCAGASIRRSETPDDQQRKAAAAMPAIVGELVPPI